MYLTEQQGFTYNRLGVKYVRCNRPYTAIKYFDKALSINKEPEFYYNLAIVEEKVGDIQKSVECLHKVLGLNNNDPESKYELKAIKDRENLRERKSAVKKNDFYNIGSNNLKSNKKFNEIVEMSKYCRYQINLDPQDPTNYNALGLKYDEMGLPHMAIRSYKKAISLNNETSAYYFNLGLSENDILDHKDSILHIEKAIELKPGDASYYDQLGVVNENDNNSYEALKDYKRATILDSVHPDYYYDYASLEYRLGHDPISYKYANKALKLDPRNKSYKELARKVKPSLSSYNPKINYTSKLKTLIGLRDIKSRLKKDVNRVILYKIRTKHHNHGQMHLVFEGNPGTGKTTVAKLLCKILYQKHITTSKRCVAVNATQLVASKYGESAKNVRKVIRKAMGGVLFIDEAYDLAHRTDGNSACQDEAMNEFLPDIEKYKDNLVVIMAGYTKQMELFLNHSNPGLISRFPPKDRIQFPNYCNDECMRILDLYLKQNNLTINSVSAKAYLSIGLSNFINDQRKRHPHTFANARLMRNIYDDLDDNFSNRLMNKYTTNQLVQFKSEKNPVINAVNLTDVKNTLSHINKIEQRGKDQSNSIGFK